VPSKRGSSTRASSTTSDWRKSSFSGNGDGSDCPGLAAHNGTVRLRESTAPDAVVTASPRQLAAFIRAVKADAGADADADAGAFSPGGS
jgi:hypothetical protein